MPNQLVSMIESKLTDVSYTLGRSMPTKDLGWTAPKPIWTREPKSIGCSRSLRPAIPVARRIEAAMSVAKDLVHSVLSDPWTVK